MNGKVCQTTCRCSLLASDISRIQYVMPWGKRGVPREEVFDEKLMEELWTWLEARVAEHRAKQPV